MQPKDAAVRWAQDRLVASGDRLTFRYIVREASVVEIPLPVSGGITGMLTTDQSERYEARTVVDMQVLDGHQIQGSDKAVARRPVTGAEDSSLHEREEVGYRLTEDTMRDLEQRHEPHISQAFFPNIVH